MKSSTSMLAVLFLVVAAALGLGVYLILSGTTTQSSGPGPNPIDISNPDGTSESPGGITQRHVRNPRNGATAVPRTLKITGRVTDADGEPLPGVTVRQYQPAIEKPEKSTAVWDQLQVLNGLIDLDEEQWDRPRPLAVLSKRPARLRESRPPGNEILVIGAEPARTDNEGRFILEFGRSAGAGPFVLHAEKDGVGQTRAAGVKAGADVEMRIGSKTTVKGVILTANEGHGVPNAYILLDDGENQVAANTDGEGRFVLEGLGPGQYRATAGAENFPPLTDHLVQVRKDEDLEIRLPIGVDLRIRAVVDHEDLGPSDRAPPLVGAEIVAIHEETYAYVLGKTDSDGRISFAALPPGTWLVNGQKAGFATLGEEAVKLDAVRGTQDLELSFEPTVLTPILAVDQNGTPIEGVTFFTNTWSDQYEQARSLRIPGQTDAGGRFGFHFEFDGPRAMIYAVKKGYGIRIVAPDDETDGKLLRVTLRKGATVSGIVRGPDDQPIAGATVSIESTPSDEDAPEDPIMWIISDEKGRYSFDHLPMGDIMIEAWMDDAISDDVEFEVDGTTMSFVKDLKFD